MTLRTSVFRHGQSIAHKAAEDGSKGDIGAGAEDKWLPNGEVYGECMIVKKRRFKYSFIKRNTVEGIILSLVGL